MPRARGPVVVAAAFWLATAPGCALPAAEWDVSAGSERRFAEARKVCHQLTAPDAARFEDCMERRGFERESLAKRSWRALTGG